MAHQPRPAPNYDETVQQNELLRPPKKTNVASQEDNSSLSRMHFNVLSLYFCCCIFLHLKTETATVALNYFFVFVFCTLFFKSEFLNLL